MTNHWTPIFVPIDDVSSLDYLCCKNPTSAPTIIALSSYEQCERSFSATPFSTIVHVLSLCISSSADNRNCFVFSLRPRLIIPKFPCSSSRTMSYSFFAAVSDKMSVRSLPAVHSQSDWGKMEQSGSSFTANIWTAGAQRPSYLSSLVVPNARSHRPAVGHPRCACCFTYENSLDQISTSHYLSTCLLKIPSLSMCA